MKPSDRDRHDIEAFLRGDTAVVASIRDAVERVVRGFQFPGRDLERELVQEVLGRLLRNLNAARFRGESTLRTYAQRVAKYACLERIRRRRLEVRVDFEAVPSAAGWSDAEAAYLRKEEHLRNLRVFAALPDDARALLRLIFVEGLSYAEAAERLGVSEGAIKSRVHRARLACRDAIGALPPSARRPAEEVER